MIFFDNNAVISNVFISLFNARKYRETLLLKNKFKSANALFQSRTFLFPRNFIIAYTNVP